MKTHINMNKIIPISYRNHFLNSVFFQNLVSLFKLPSLHARSLILPSKMWLSLILPVLKHSLPKIILCVQTWLLNNLKPMPKFSILMHLMSPTSLPYNSILPMLLLILKLSSFISMVIFAMSSIWTLTLTNLTSSVTPVTTKQK